jgi:transcriptional regulator with XRE-family HTH domain
MKKSIIAVRVGNKIREERIRKGLSQEDLAEKCGLHRTYIGSVERGEYNLTIGSLDRIAKALSSNMACLVTI